jgi:hypothetical protein
VKVAKLIKKAGEYFSDEKKEQKKKIKDLEKIIAQLGTKRKKIHKQLKNESNKKRKKDINKEYNAVVKLLHKARTRHCKLS